MFAKYGFSNFPSIARTTDTIHYIHFVFCLKLFSIPPACTVYIRIRNVRIQLLFTIRENFCPPTNLLQFVYGSLCRGFENTHVVYRVIDPNNLTHFVCNIKIRYFSAVRISRYKRSNITTIYIAHISDR